MIISYQKLTRLMETKGDSFNSLYMKGVLTNYASRKLRNNEYVDILYLAKICVYYNVPIEDIVEVI